MKRLLLSALLAAVTLPSFAQSVSFSLVTAPCNNNGVLNAVVTGMTPPFTVQWYTQGTDGTVITHPAVTGSVDALLGYSGGPVTVVVSNSLATATNTYAGAPPFTYSTSNTPAACPASGTASVTVTGGTAPYTYNWYNVATNAYIASTPSISATAGSYGVTITDAAGCVYGSKVDPDASTIADISPFSITLTATTASCTNGSATVATVSSGATAPLSYAWSNGGRTATIGSLLTGSYSVSVTDALGCQATGSIAVPQSLTIAAGIITTAANCSNNDGTITTFTSGGTAPYTYLWSNGATTSSQTCLGAGAYRVTVTDANGCIANDVAFVGTSTPITVTSSASPSLCSAPSGNAALTISGGTGSYAVTWYTTPVQTTPTAINLTPGTYAFKVTDGTGCEQSGSVVVPPVNTISASWAATSAMCTGATGALSVTPTGGTPPYSYLWSNGASTSSISGLAAGNYNVKITDNLGCTLSRSLYVPANTTVGAGLSLIPSSCLFSNDGAISATPFGGTAPYSYGWSSGGVTPVIAALPAGPYFLNVTDAAGCVSHSYSLLDYDSTNHGCFCTITGIVYADTNNNCVQDPGEWAIPNVQIMCSGRGYTYTDASGRYSFQVPSGTYTITETVPAAYPLASCQSNNITVTSIAGPACLNTVDFANAAIPVHDLRISTWNMSAAVPGNVYHQKILITNEGTSREDSAIAAYKADGQLLVPAFIPGCLFSAMGSHYYYADSLDTLPIGATKAFDLAYTVPTNIPLGTVVTFKDTTTFVAPISTWVSDFTPYNNVCTHTTTLRASFEPNFKDVHPKGLGSAGTITSADSILEYMVHFQNMGAVFAQNVTVIDTLDNNLDWTSLHPVYMSHPAKVTLTQSGLMRIATYRFENINLATASMDDARSQGIFTYTIKTRSGLPIGSTFKNRASIYFDYNEPVRTNQTLNTLGAGTTPINEVTQLLPAENGFRLYPNPASRSFYVLLNDATAATINITDLTGKILVSKEISGSQAVSTDVSQLAPGIYFVTLNQNGKSQTQKLVIMK